MLICGLNMNNLSNVKIHNFRGIKDLEISNLKQFSVIVGNNDIGKTSILEALIFSVFPNNPSLAFGANLARNIDVIDNDFWLSFFNTFQIENNPTIIDTFSNGELWTLELSPIFSNSETVSFNNYEKISSIDQAKYLKTEGEKNIIGLNSTFTIKKADSEEIKSYKSDISFTPTTSQLTNTPDKEYHIEEKGFFLNQKSFLDNNSISERFDNISNRNQEGNFDTHARRCARIRSFDAEREISYRREHSVLHYGRNHPLIPHCCA